MKGGGDSSMLAGPGKEIQRRFKDNMYSWWREIQSKQKGPRAQGGKFTLGRRRDTLETGARKEGRRWCSILRWRTGC